MPELAQFQNAMTRALRGDSDAIAPYLKAPETAPLARVYRNNMMSAIVDGLMKDYPAVERLVGTEFLRGAARIYVEAHPPRERALTLYGETFPDFLESFSPARTLPYLADVARLDRAWIESLFAPEASSLSPEDLADLDDTTLEELAPGLHPSVRIHASPWPAHELWRLNRSATNIRPMKIQRAWSAAVIWRNGGRVMDRVLSPAEYEFLICLRYLGTFKEAESRVGRVASGFNASGFFAECLINNLFANRAHA